MATSWIEVPENKPMEVGHQYALTYTVPLPYNDVVRKTIDAAIFAADDLRPDYRVLRVIHTRPNPGLANGKKPIPWTVRIELVKESHQSAITVQDAANAVKAKLKSIAGAATNVLEKPWQEAKTIAADVASEIRMVVFFAAVVLVTYFASSRR